MAQIKISGQTIKSSCIEINPYVDEDSNIVFESIVVTCSEVPVFLKEKAYYDGEVSGENEDTGKPDTHSFKHYKLNSVHEGKILLIHPEFSFKYELDMYVEPKTKSM